MIGLYKTPDGHDQPQVLAGFEHIRRYWDRTQQCFAAKILPGEFYVTRFNEAVITTLGSCVSACIRDRVNAVGGMNHFMLPEAGNQSVVHAGDLTEAARYGSFAMEQLINEVLKAGGRRENLEIKLVGGGRVLANMSTDVGAKNIRFARDYVAREGFRVEGSDLGGKWPRRVIYFPASGKVRVKKLRSQEVVSQEKAYQDQISHQPVQGDIELF